MGEKVNLLYVVFELKFSDSQYSVIEQLRGIDRDRVHTLQRLRGIYRDRVHTMQQHRGIYKDRGAYRAKEKRGWVEPGFIFVLLFFQGLLLFY